MNWIGFSLLSAFFDAFVHVLSKKALKVNSHYIVSISMTIFTAIFCAIWSYLNGIPKLDLYFFKIATLASVMGGVGMLCFLSGLKKSDISFAIPLLCFGPIFTALWEWLFLDGSMSLMGFMGVVIVLVGTYSMELDQVKNGYLAPIKSLYYNTGARLVFAASLIWSLSSMLDKVGVLNTNAVVWTGVVNFFMSIFLFLAGLFSKNIAIKNLNTKALLSKNTLFLFCLSLFFSLMLVLQLHAFSLINVAYVLSLKRASILLSVLAGFVFFNEQKMKERIIATLIMVFGGVIIILFA